MDVLKHLHATVAQTFEDSFNNAYKDLNDMLVLRDTEITIAKERVRVAEEACKNAIAEVEQLRGEITLQKEDLHQGDNKSDDGASIAELQLERVYAPQNVLKTSNRDELCSQRYNTREVEAIQQKYSALYGDAQTLAKALEGLKKQIKRHKRKLGHWSKCFECDKFTLVLDGAIVTYQRVGYTEDESHDPLLQTQPNPAPVTIQPVNHGIAKSVKVDPHGLTIPELSCNASVNVENKLSELCSGQSPHGENMQTSSVQSCPSPKNEADIYIASSSRALKRKRTSLSRLPVSGYHSEYEGSKQFVTAKSESLPSSPMRSCPQYCGSVGVRKSNSIDISAETATKKSACNLYRHCQASFATAESPPNMGQVSQKTPDRSMSFQTVEDDAMTVHGFRPCTENKTRRSPVNITSHAVSSIAEDGDQISCRAPENTEVKGLLGVSDSAASSAQRRLQGLLEGPLPSKRLLQSQRSPESPDGFHRRRCQTPGTWQQSSLKDCTGMSIRLPKSSDPLDTNRQSVKQEKLAGTSVRREIGCNLPKVQSGGEPYRAWPLQRLGLDHFKINSNHNDGLDYAFGTVVRNKHERNCIKGCTRPECCGGKFKAMARIGGLRTDPTIPCQEEDKRLLEEYMGGDQLSDKLEESERQGFLDEARARHLANRYGKHKNQHQRPGTPPGFWRTDMPDTQELEHDREEAKRFEKEKVEERYRDAMRPGGLWKFAD
ncbi:DNA repair protein endonuclease SAE2/CtIP C-terminus-domain-containing protein, partial [Aspergillus avenaceus]